MAESAASLTPYLVAGLFGNDWSLSPELNNDGNDLLGTVYRNSRGTH